METLAACQEWFETFVLGEGLCPYAERPHRDGLIHWSECVEVSFEKRAEHFLLESQRLVEALPSEIQTSLLVYPHAEPDFDEFLQFVGTCEDLLGQVGADSVLTPVGFHPHFRFEDSEPGDLAPFVNRSPAPMIHLLRRVDLEAVPAEKGREISDRNSQHMTKLGRDFLEKLFNRLSK